MIKPLNYYANRLSEGLQYSDLLKYDAPPNGKIYEPKGKSVVDKKKHNKDGL